MGFWYLFSVTPPVDETAFDAWHASLGEDQPLADCGDSLGAKINVHGSYTSRSGFLYDYWPQLIAWVHAQGSEITLDHGDTCPNGIERTPETG